MNTISGCRALVIELELPCFWTHLVESRMGNQLASLSFDDPGLLRYRSQTQEGFALLDLPHRRSTPLRALIFTKGSTGSVHCLPVAWPSKGL